MSKDERVSRVAAKGGHNQEMGLLYLGLSTPLATRCLLHGVCEQWASLQRCAIVHQPRT